MPGASSNHKGVDISAPKGTPIKAIEGGKVIKAGAENESNLKQGFGYRVTIQHEWGVSTYAHMNERPNVEEGSIIEAGHLLGEVGETGNGSGVHLHFEMKEKAGKGEKEIEPTEG